MKHKQHNFLSVFVVTGKMWNAGCQLFSIPNRGSWLSSAKQSDAIVRSMYRVLAQDDDQRVMYNRCIKRWLD